MTERKSPLSAPSGVSSKLKQWWWLLLLSPLCCGFFAWGFLTPQKHESVTSLKILPLSDLFVESEEESGDKEAIVLKSISGEVFERVSEELKLSEKWKLSAKETTAKLEEMIHYEVKEDLRIITVASSSAEDAKEINKAVVTNLDSDYRAIVEARRQNLLAKLDEEFAEQEKKVAEKLNFYEKSQTDTESVLDGAD